MAPRKRVGLSKSMAKSDVAANQFTRNADKPRTPLYGRSKVVADSDASEDEPIENEDDNDIISRTKGSNNKKPANGFAVVINTRNTQRRQTSNTKKGVTSPSSISSNTTNTGDQSSTYDTPGTSAVATPAEAIVLSSKTNQGSRKISMSMRAAQLRNSDLSLSSGNQKRKRHAGEDHDSDSALGKSYTGFEDDSALPSESALGDSIIDMARPKKRKVKTGRQERQQSIDEQVALALEREENELLDAQIATAISESINQEMDVDSSSDSESESESDDVPLLSRSRRGKTGASMKGSKGRKDIKNGRLGSIARKPMKLPSRPARSEQPHLNQEISDSEGESDSSGLSTGFEDSDDWDSPLSELGLKATSKSMSKRSNITKGKAQGRKKWETDEEPLASMASETDSEEGAPSGPQLPNRKGFRPSRGANRTQREREKLIWQHPEILTMWGDLDKEPKIIPEQAKQPEGINRELKSFQLEGLNWMVKQEKTIWKGGLLGDEMGMGKTIQAVSLIMSDFPAKNPTLVVVPPVALMQWQSEISDYTNGALKVLVYHGTNSKIKGLKKKDLMKYNVIMISYSGLESMYRKEQKGWSRKDEDGDAIIVKEDSLMHSIQWHRIILDEAHNIKSRSAGVAKACFAMNADYKWCLSGTPLQNRIGEFFSLLRFLEVKPFACYMCKACSCKELHWTLDFKTKRCDKCSHGGFHHVSIFNHELLDPIQAHGHRGPGKEAFDKLKLLTDRLMLRRMKRDHTTAMELPPKDVTINNQFFGEEEHDFASSIMSNTNRQFETYVARGVMLNNYANIFGLIMQMRQVADHPDLILKKHAEGGQNILICVICDEPAEDAIRSTCRHDFCRRCVKGYVRSFDDSEAVPDCPRCHISLSIDLEQPEKEQDESAVKKSSIINRIKMENWTSSSKIELLVYELYKLRATGRTHKSIVFSQFTSMLQLVEWRLHRAGFNTVMLDGTMSPAQRQSSIKYFMDTVDVEVFLVSLKAGGVALNLTEASRVFIVDPWWNPAAEWQSADRCHRIGQHRPCSITRLCIEDSVESRMVLLQEKKANMINSTINADESAMQNLTPQDMQFLFRGS